MKKPHVLNRSMFKTGGTSAYGRGITSNLVSDEQRQRFNYGGRVGLFNGGDPTSFGQNPLLYRSLPPGTYDFDPKSMYKIGKLNLEDMYTRENLYPEWKETWTPKPYIDPIITPQEESEERQMLKLKEEDPVKFEEMYGQWAEEKYGKKKQKRKELFESAGITSDFLEDKPGIIEEVVGEAEPSWAGIPGEEDPSAASTIAKDDTDLLDTPDKWAFLDEYEAKKKKQGRGQALWEGAAAAIDWGTSGTAKERSKAISTGLRKVGAIGAKYTGEAMDLSAKAKILGAIEEEKHEGKLALKEKDVESWYGPRIKILEAQQKLAEDIQRRAIEGEDPKDIYADIRMPKKGDILTADKHQFLIQELTGETLTIENDDNSKDLRDGTKNNGLVFIDKVGKIKKNVEGKIIDWDPRQDPNFTWKKD